ncbi:MAG: hypothetical protein R2822_27085 [Spirosomataceae bacterium]
MSNVSGSAIIYVRNRRRTQEIAHWLNKNGVKTSFIMQVLLTNNAPRNRMLGSATACG